METKDTWQIQPPFFMKNNHKPLNKIGTLEYFFNLIKYVYLSPKASIVLRGNQWSQDQDRNDGDATEHRESGAQGSAGLSRPLRVSCIVLGRVPSTTLDNPTASTLPNNPQHPLPSSLTVEDSVSWFAETKASGLAETHSLHMYPRTGRAPHTTPS